MKVYIAGASKEITRAERWGQRLRDYGIDVVSTWVENIRKVGRANPTDATKEQYVEWAESCLGPIRQAGVLWLLLPEADTIGMYVELGYAHALGRLVVGSGRHRPIFTPALVKYHSHYDAEIADYLKRLSKADSGDLPTPQFREGVDVDPKEWAE